jgi:hypothetical protein
VLVELDLLVGGKRRLAEERKLRLRLLDRFQDCPRGDALVDMKRNNIWFKRGMLCLARPDQLRVQMRVVGLAGSFPLSYFIGGSDAGRRVVLAPRLCVAEIKHAVRICLMRLLLARH